MTIHFVVSKNSDGRIVVQFSTNKTELRFAKRNANENKAPGAKVRTFPLKEIAGRETHDAERITGLAKALDKVDRNDWSYSLEQFLILGGQAVQAYME